MGFPAEICIIHQQLFNNYAIRHYILYAEI